MTFNLTLKTDNAAFRDDSARDEDRDDDSASQRECARILRNIARLLDVGYREGPLTDSNGNTVGSWSWS